MGETGSLARCCPVVFCQVLWTFSIYLEAVAILPQLVLLQRTNNIDNLTGNYVFLLGWVEEGAWTQQQRVFPQRANQEDGACVL